MNGQLQALRAELLKIRHSGIRQVTFIAFGLAPVMGGVFMLMMRNPGALAKAGGLNAKAQAMGLSADWNAYLAILTQAVGVGGILVFGFVASWIFGREYSDNTAKDLLALPTSRTKILNAKFVVYAAWCFALALSNLAAGLVIGTALGLAPAAAGVVAAHLTGYALTTLLTVLVGTPIAFFALWGKGYLAPLGFVALALVFAQIVAATGFGHYFPWSVAGLFSGTAGEYQARLDFWSYTILILTGIAGYLSAVVFWKYTDQH